MKRNTVLEISALLFLVCVIIVSGCAREIDISSEPEPLNKDYSAQLKVCEGLSYQDCSVNDNCLVKYGPSYCSGNVCTDDLVFKSCGPSGLNSDEIIQIKTECKNINGEVRKDSFAGYECLCEKPDYLGKYRCLQELINELKTN